MRYITLNQNNIVESVRYGKEIIEGEIESEIGEIGQIMQPNGSFIDPIKSLNEVKNDKITELQQFYYGSFKTFQSSALGELKTYPIDAEAQENLRDYQSRLIADPNKETFYFKTIEDGTLVLHNRTQFLQLMEDAEMFKVTQTIKINDLINQLNACTTNEEVESITW